jgi:hypothetical protein
MAKGRKTGGRQKGTPNKVSTELREIINEIVREALTPDVINALSMDKRVDLVIRLMPYLLAKYADIAAESGQTTQPNIFINWNPPEQNKQSPAGTV